MRRGIPMNTYFDYDRRTSRDERGYHLYPGPDNLEGLKIAYHETLASIDGAHYHCWIPDGLSKDTQKELLEKFQRMAVRKGDPVCFSFDYLPKEKSHELDV